jgi:hypothetical protein
MAKSAAAMTAGQKPPASARKTSSTSTLFSACSSTLVAWKTWGLMPNRDTSSMWLSEVTGNQNSFIPWKSATRTPSMVRPLLM